jgi:hypothetical protein
MSFPPEIDKKINESLTELVSDIGAVLQVDTQGYGYNILEVQQFYSVRTRLLSVLTLLSSPNLDKLADEVRSIGAIGFIMPFDAAKVLGIIRSVQSDYSNGMLTSISKLIEANIAGDYLGQAEQLLTEGKSGNYDHVPAAVLTGAILEDSLRRLCSRQNPTIPINKADGEPKKMAILIEELKKANVYNEIIAKELRLWTGIRNSAAHGKFDEFTREQVEQMLKGVQRFLADYM